MRMLGNAYGRDSISAGGKRGGSLALWMAIACAFALALALVGCADPDGSGREGASDGRSSSADGNAPSASSSAGSSGLSVGEAYERFLEVDMGMTMEEVNAILGEPVETEEPDGQEGARSNYEYGYMLGENFSTVCDIHVFFSGEDDTVAMKTYNLDTGIDYFRDPEVDLSGYQKVKDEEVTTYDGCVDLFGSEGYLTACDLAGNGDVLSYEWVDEKGGSVNVTFGPDGSVRSMSGLVKE